MDPFNKAIFPKKVLLTGSDCFHLVLEKHADRHRAGSNTMRIVFYFNNRPDVGKIKNAFHDYPLIYWLCNIELSPGRPFGIPRWLFRDKGNHIVIRELQHPVPTEIPQSILQRDIPLNGDRFIEADVVYYPGNKTAFVLSWNHILMDVKGIRLLIDYINDAGRGNKNYPVELFFPKRVEKTGLIQHIRNMYQVKAFIESSAKPPVASVATKNGFDRAAFLNSVLHFTEEETRSIHQLAIQNGAGLGVNPYHLSCCSLAVNNILKLRKKTGVLWVPVPYDGRPKGSAGPVISNTVAFVFYRIPEKALTGVKETIACLSGQLRTQIKEKMPRKYGRLLNMMRHIPLWLYYFLVTSNDEGSFASFLYSSAGESFNDLGNLLGEPVDNISIFPLPTFPPGLTFSFQKHHESLNINIAWSPDMLDAFELSGLEADLKNYLLGKAE